MPIKCLLLARACRSDDRGGTAENWSIPEIDARRRAGAAYSFASPGCGWIGKIALARIFVAAGTQEDGKIRGCVLDRDALQQFASRRICFGLPDLTFVLRDFQNKLATHCRP